MTRRGFYRLGIVLPIVGFLAAAVLRGYFGFERPLSAATGARTEWVYPPSLARGLVAYLGVAVWAWRLVAGSSGEIARSFWQGPFVFVALNWLLVAAFAVTQERGVAALAEQCNVIALRTVVHPTRLRVRGRHTVGGAAHGRVQRSSGASALGWCLTGAVDIDFVRVEAAAGS